MIVFLNNTYIVGILIEFKLNCIRPHLPTTVMTDFSNCFGFINLRKRSFDDPQALPSPPLPPSTLVAVSNESLTFSDKILFTF